jgi:hypothetical protein
MKRKLNQLHHLRPRHILSFLMVCAIPLSALNLQLHPKVGSSSSFSMSSIQKISFFGGNLIITKKDASTSSFPLSSTGYLNFTDVATALPMDLKSVINTYPNPAQELLHIEIQLFDNQSAKLEIINLVGKVVVCTKLCNPSNTVSIADLPKGMYLCRVQNGNETSTAKFIKQ